MEFNEKVVVITGAAKGIGRGVAHVFNRYNAKIAIADIDVEMAKKTAKEITDMGGTAFAFEMNVASSESINKAVAGIAEKFGTIDILINCAGIVCSSKLHELDEQLWDRVIDINLKSVFLVSKAVIPFMKKNGSGSIVNFSSQAAKIGELGNGVYCASKAGVSMLTQVQALELAEHKINVNAVAPGYTNTEIMQSVFLKRGPLEGMTPEQYETKLLSDVPLKRMAEPEEIGELVAFLAGEKARYITGITVTIAGGKVLI